MKRYIITTLAIFAACILLGVSFPAQSAQTDNRDLDALLTHVQDAAANVVCVAEGTTTLHHHGKLVTSAIKVYHGTQHRRRIEYLTPPLKGLIVISDEKHTWRYDPKEDRVVVTDHSHSSNPEDRRKSLVSNHRVRIACTGKKAGRDAILLKMTSATGSIKKEIWLDASTYEKLANTDYNDKGEFEASTEFTSIKYVNSLPDRLFKDPKRDHPFRELSLSKPISLEELSKQVGFKVSIPTFVPAGYKLDGYWVYKSRRHPVNVAYTRYTDGLDTISIFEMRRDDACKFHVGHGEYPADSYIAKDLARGHIGMMTAHGRSFAIIGDDPRKIKKIADSLK